MAAFLDTTSEAAPEIRVLSKNSVSPSSLTPRHPLFLPELDALWRDIHYNRRVLFYLPPPLSAAASDAANGPSRSSISQHLKLSLSDCLVHYFPWCGRLAPRSKPSHHLFIDCNDAGVEFVEACIDMPMSKLALDGFQMKPFFDQLAPNPNYHWGSSFSMPLLFIQLTFFSDCGFSLGVSHNHVVADGQSLWNFMLSWAECARGVPLSLPPLHDRKLLFLQEASREKAALWSLVYDLKEKTDGDVHRSNDERKQEAPLPIAQVTENPHKDAASPSGIESDPLVQCALELSSSAVKKLNSEAGEGFSSYTVICAHIWQRTTAARQIESGAITHFTVLANCRNRLLPPLPSAYFGNVIAYQALVSPAGEISTETLHATASRIHQLSAAVQSSITNFMHYVELHRQSVMEIYLATGIVSKGHNVASSVRFPVYEVDFGWGKPAAVRATKVSQDGEIVFFGGRPGGSQGDVEICTALPVSVLKRLLGDPLCLFRLPRGQQATGGMRGG